jgi:hypothetical protein
MFKLLTTLDLSYNYFSIETDLMPLVRLYRLADVMLYGNPLLGPTGEDPLKIYVEELDTMCMSARAGRDDNPINLLTEAPKKRVIRKGQHLGRQAIYKHVPIILVEPSQVESKLSRKWREEGNFTLFAEAMRVVSQELRGEGHDKDYTFLTTVEDVGSIQSESSRIKKQICVSSRRRRGPTEREEIVRDTQTKVEAMMSKVMANMGLLEEPADVRAIRDKISVRSASKLT